MTRGEKTAVILGVGVGIPLLMMFAFYAATAFVEMVNLPFVEEEEENPTTL